MLLAGENGTEFELGLIEDRLDEIQDGEGDDTALTISFRVATPQEEWEETAPSINAYELKNLVEWLEGVVGRRPDVPELELLEPELKFSVVGDRGDQVTLRINFHLEARPEEYRIDAPTDVDHVDIKIAREQVRAAAQELKRDLEELDLAKEKEEEEPVAEDASLTEEEDEE
jgi:hypothetical protein